MHFICKLSCFQSKEEKLVYAVTACFPGTVSLDEDQDGDFEHNIFIEG